MSVITAFRHPTDLEKNKDRCKDTKTCRVPTVRNSVKEYRPFFSELTDEAFEPYEYMFESMDAIASEILNSTDVENVEFTIDPACMSDIVMAAQEGPELPWRTLMIYKGTGENGMQYSLFFDAEHDYRSDDISSISTLSRTDGNGIYKYRTDTAEWFRDSDEEELEAMADTDDNVSGFLYDMTILYGLPVQMLDCEKLLLSLQNAEPLFDLVNRLEGIGRLGYIIETDGSLDPEDGDIRIAVCADDGLRHGTFIGMKDGKYEVIRLFDGDEYNGRDFNVIVFNKRQRRAAWHFMDTVFVTDDIETVLKLLNPMWDKYDRNEEWLTIPVSERIYLNMKYGTCGKPEPIYVFGKNKLTATEREAMDDLEDLFCGNGQ